MVASFAKFLLTLFHFNSHPVVRHQHTLFLNFNAVVKMHHYTALELKLAETSRNSNILYIYKEKENVSKIQAVEMKF
jgi:hypothetical protein